MKPTRSILAQINKIGDVVDLNSPSVNRTIQQLLINRAWQKYGIENPPKLKVFYCNKSHTLYVNNKRWFRTDRQHNTCKRQYDLLGVFQYINSVNILIEVGHFDNIFL